MSNGFIPVNEPLLDGSERRLLLECIETGWISSEGPFVELFEQGFSSQVGRKHGIAVCNGTAALEVALAALDIGPGDEVIIPAFTIISCAAAVIRCGAMPVLVDCDPVTWNMDVSQVEAKITGRTRAIMAVHIYGLPVDMPRLETIAARHGLKIIEDAAEAHGLSCDNRSCGSFGTVSTFSFYPNKLLTTGEGGMVVTDCPEIAKRCRSLRNLCFDNRQRFVHEELGWNYRMTNLQAALGMAQLERQQLFAGKKRAMGKRYRELLAGIPAELPAAATSYAENIYWVFGLVLHDDLSFDARRAMELLGSRGVGTRPFFWPMHEQPVFRRRGMFAGEAYPVAERLSRRGFYLPSGLALTSEQMERVASELRSILAGG